MTAFLLDPEHVSLFLHYSYVMDLTRKFKSDCVSSDLVFSMNTLIVSFVFCSFCEMSVCLIQ